VAFAVSYSPAIAKTISFCKQCRIVRLTKINANTLIQNFQMYLRSSNTFLREPYLFIF